MKKSKNNAGFTLVELIVVIAIMAILAGVGTVAYTGYIKSANKKADMTLVGNIMRAIDTGINSYAFEIPEALQMEDAEVTIPAGFIVLTDTGVKAIESNTAQENLNSTKPCKIVTRDVYESATRYIFDKKGWFGSTQKIVGYELGTPTTVTYCEVHGHVTKIENAKTGHPGVEPNGKTTFYLMQDSTKLYADHIDGETINMPTYVNSTDDTIVEDGIINSSLVAAFGEEWQSSNVQLKYNEWESASVSIPTFYNDASNMWTSVQQLSDTAAGASRLNAVALAVGKDLGFNQEYKSGEDLLANFALQVSKMDKQTFVNNWVNAPTNNIDYGLGFEGNGRENYSAARKLYNTSLASYIKQNHSDDTETPEKENEVHATAIEQYSESIEIAGIPLQDLPKFVCKQSFEGVSEISDGNPLNGGCTECQNLLKKYVTDGSCKANAEAAYDTFVTVKNTSGIASEMEGGFWQYYQRYLNEYTKLYSKVNETIGNANSSIVISLFYENGTMRYEVIPSEANPRKE